MRRLVVQFHGANRYSRWLYRQGVIGYWLATAYYWVVRKALTTYWYSEDDGKTWKWL